MNSNAEGVCPTSVVAALSSSLHLETALFHALKAFAAEGLAADGVFANILWSENRTVEFLAGATHAGGQIMKAQIALTEEMLKLRGRSVKDVSRADRLEEDPFTACVAPQCVPDIRSFVMMRLEMESRHLGVVCFWSRKAEAFTAEDEMLLASAKTLFALNVGFALSERLRASNERLMTENRELARAVGESVLEPEIVRLVTNTPSFARMTGTLRQAGRFDVPVLITGESGTGKEVIAQTIHAISRRRGKPFVRVNCSAIPESLMESEFFGHEEGAFTNAVRRHLGYFEEAGGGTLFLDEIGELPLAMQVKLLHALQNQTIRRVGGTKEIAVDVRIMAATNRDLEKLVRERRFRLDLFYRLNVLPMHLSPLRERPIDIEPLIALFAREYAQAYGLERPPIIRSGAIREAEMKRWPGNVRQLRNVVARTLMLTSGSIEQLAYSGDEDRLFGQEDDAGESQAQASSGKILENNVENWSMMTFEDAQRRYFSLVLQRTGGKIAGRRGAAAVCGLPVSTLRSRLERLGLVQKHASDDAASMKEID